MEKKQSSVEQVFSHIKASRNDIQYWNDSMLVDWLLEQEDRLKAIHKEEVKESYREGRSDQQSPRNVHFITEMQSHTTTKHLEVTMSNKDLIKAVAGGAIIAVIIITLMYLSTIYSIKI